MFKRVLTAVTVGGILVASSVAAASALQANGPLGNTVTEQAGVAADFSCDEDGVTAGVFGVELNDQSVRNLVVSGIHEDCFGSVLGYKVENAAGVALAQGDLVIDETTETKNIGAISIADIEKIILVIMG